MLLFLGGVGGADVMGRLENELPDENAARTLGRPTLLALGSETGPIFRESNTALTAVLANIEHLEVSDAGHFLHVEQPEQVADGLAAFLRRNTARG